MYKKKKRGGGEERRIIHIYIFSQQKITKKSGKVKCASQLEKIAQRGVSHKIQSFLINSKELRPEKSV